MDSTIREQFIIKNIYRYQRIYRRTFMICAVVIGLCLAIALHPFYRGFGLYSAMTMAVLATTQFNKMSSFKKAIASIEAGDDKWRSNKTVLHECDVESGRTGFAVVALALLIVICLISGIALMIFTSPGENKVVRMVAILFLCSAAYLVSSFIVYLKMFRGSIEIENLEIQSGLYTEEQIQEMREDRRSGINSSITLMLFAIIPIAIGLFFSIPILLD